MARKIRGTRVVPLPESRTPGALLYHSTSNATLSLPLLGRTMMKAYLQRRRKLYVHHARPSCFEGTFLLLEGSRPEEASVVQQHLQVIGMPVFCQVKLFRTRRAIQPFRTRATPIRVPRTEDVAMRCSGQRMKTRVRGRLALRAQ